MREWPPLESGTLFGGGAPGGGGVESSALLAVVLNYALPPCTPAVWAAARLRVAADGGANRLFDELPALLPHRDAEEVRNAFVPAVVMGDMDSARPEVLAFYAARGALILDASDDQDTTDLQKCVAFALHAASADPRLGPPPHAVAVLGALGGRLDHQLSALSVLHAHPGVRLTLLGRHAAATLLPPGRHAIRPATPHEGPVCGLVPLAGPAVVTTAGLKWDLHATRLAMGELVSTSNAIAAAEVRVETDAPLVWTTQLHFAAPHAPDEAGGDDADGA